MIEFNTTLPLPSVRRRFTLPDPEDGFVIAMPVVFSPPDPTGTSIEAPVINTDGGTRVCSVPEIVVLVRLS